MHYLQFTTLGYTDRRTLQVLTIGAPTLRWCLLEAVETEISAASGPMWLEKGL